MAVVGTVSGHFLSVQAIAIVVDSLVFGKLAEDCLAQSAERRANVPGPRARFKPRLTSGRQAFIKLLGKQGFRFPILSTFRFWVDWKQSKHARKKNKQTIFRSLKTCFLQRPMSSHRQASLSFLQGIGGKPCFRFPILSKYRF